jgi:hypothetical protein
MRLLLIFMGYWTKSITNLKNIMVYMADANHIIQVDRDKKVKKIY